ncbi:MAG: CapA family protein [Parachlamydiales bacterium]|nr:CapA family protein [Candidatus Acheromyda pituitae]
MPTADEKKFLCDQMCLELGKWLRIAGYDTAILDNTLEDQKVYQKAVYEKRRLLTRDRYFIELDPERKTVIYLKGESLDGWVEQLKEEEKVDWLYNPFSRCLHCNALLEKTDSPDVPEKILENTKEFWSCPDCCQIFWLGSHTERMLSTLKSWQDHEVVLTIGLGGDLMIGRLVDQFLEHRSPSYVWGDLHPLLAKMDFNLVNLETTLTRSKKLRIKVFNFKADPKRVAVLKEAPIHAVNIANNHILDFAEEGLLETIEVLDAAHILHSGAGKDLSDAIKPAIFEKKGIKIGVIGCTDNEPDWKAGPSHPGTNFVDVGNLELLREQITNLRSQVDLLILSVHWGPNMRRRPPSHFRDFAHALIDLGVDIVHGHSAHVFQGVEIYKQKLILFDTGDLADDYAVDSELRNDLSFFFVVKANKKKMLSLEMIPTAISDFQVNLCQETESMELMEKLCEELGSHPVRTMQGLVLSLHDAF